MKLLLKQKKTINASANKIKEIGNSVKKTYNNIKTNISAGYSKLKNSFIFEWGTGIGMELDSNIAGSIGGSTTFGSTYYQSKWNNYDRVSYGLTMGLDDLADVGLAKEYTNYDDVTKNFMNIPEIIKSPNTEISNQLGLKDNKTNAYIEGNFIGYSIDFYFVIGFSFKIGFIIE